MKKKWNRKGEIAVCSLMAAMVMAAAGFGMTASAEDIIDGDEIPAVREEVPESENNDALSAESSGAEAAGEAGFEVEQVVVIEDEQVPGAAAPEMDGEDADTQEEEAEEDADASEDAEAEVQEESFAGTLTYNNEEISVIVDISEEAQLPADTEVKVTRLEKGSEKYEAAKEAACRSLAADENASYTFYDVTLESEGQTLSVKEGTVSVRMEFNTEGSTAKEVVRIEETENGRVARNVTDKAAAAGKTGSVKLNY